MQTVPSLPFTGGVDRSIASRIADRSTFWDMVGMRQSYSQRGIVETAPYFSLEQTLARATYYSGGSLTEPATSKVLGMFGYKSTDWTASVSNTLQVTDYAVNVNSGQVKTYFQTTVPAAETINTCCYIVINNPTGLGLTLGNSFDVFIDGATTFQWRKNGGAFTSLVPITTTGVSVDGGNVTVYFLTATGFTIGHNWIWSRLDSSRIMGGLSGRASAFLQRGQEVFFTNSEGRVMVYQSSGAVVSAGYRPVYGSYLVEFDNHLVVGGYAKTAATVGGYPAALTVAWSDKNDFNNFFVTDVNEADSKLLPFGDDWVIKSYYCLGVFVIRQQLYVLTNQGLFYTPALGLPLVFSFQRFVNFACNLTAANSFPVCPANDIVYIVTEQGPWKFDGSSLEFVGRPVQDYFDVNNISVAPSTLLTFYNSATAELMWLNGTYLYTYHELSQTFFRRSVDFANAPTCLGVSMSNYGHTYIGAVSLALYVEDIAFALNPARDGAVGTTFITRSITEHAFVGDCLAKTKEISSVYVNATPDSTSSSTYYSINQAIQVAIYWSLSVTGIPGTFSTNSQAVWVSTNADGTISFPRLSFKALNLQINLNGLSSPKPPARIFIAGLDTQLSLRGTER